MGAWFNHSLLGKPQNFLCSWFHGNEIIDRFVRECHGNPFVSWLRRHTPFFRVKEFIWLLFVTHNYFLNPLTQGPLWGGLTWRTSPLGLIKFTSKPVKTQLFVNNAVRDKPGSKKYYPSCLTCGDWERCSLMLPLSSVPWKNCRKCSNSKEMFSFISVWLVGSSSGVGIEPGPEPHPAIFRALCVDEIQHTIFTARFLIKGNICWKCNTCTLIGR